MQAQDRCSELRRLLGMRVRELRREQGFSQESFADHCGLHRTYMGEIERGEANPSLCVLDLVAAGLGMRLTEVLEEIDARLDPREAG